ncbi:piggyBac transposable element-derived protein 3-like [Pectinophora gossypiella]|uniref:piggyBac transposable element-derived protein 3-like n=1 Tax=Pectinophora gossypiella TaxID=13191 RepID=UPI00214EBD20|nr:piggyBac transposable element-derived protein 3-like [Pectinophora gossypiella]
MNKTRKYKKPLTLNDIIVELEQNDEKEVPDSIIIMPPENCNAEVTDEDSGDEDVVLLQNLPGWQLRAPAVVVIWWYQGEACIGKTLQIVAYLLCFLQCPETGSIL